MASMIPPKSPSNHRVRTKIYKYLEGSGSCGAAFSPDSGFSGGVWPKERGVRKKRRIDIYLLHQAGWCHGISSSSLSSE